MHMSLLVASVYSSKLTITPSHSDFYNFRWLLCSRKSHRCPGALPPKNRTTGSSFTASLFNTSSLSESPRASSFFLISSMSFRQSSDKVGHILFVILHLLLLLGFSLSFSLSFSPQPLSFPPPPPPDDTLAWCDCTHNPTSATIVTCTMLEQDSTGLPPLPIISAPLGDDG